MKDARRIKRKKMVILVIVLLAALLVMSVLAWLVPRPLIESVEELEILHITAIGEDGQGQDVTDAADVERLRQELAEFSCSRMPVFMDHYALADVRYEVDGLYDGKPFHIITGNINYVYVSADQGFYEIRRGEELSALIDGLIGK